MNEKKSNVFIEAIKSLAKSLTLKLGKKLPAIIAGVVAVAVIGGIVIASAASSTPLALVEKSVTKSFQALEKNQIVSLVEKALNGGSFEVTADLSTAMGIGGANANAKLYLDAGKGMAAVTADAGMGDEALFDGMIVMDQNNIAISSDVLFDDEAYGISLKKLAERFNDSEFGPGGEFDLGIELPDSFDNLLKNSDQLTKDAEKVVAEALKVLLKSVKSNAELEKEKDTLKFNGDKVNVTAVNITVDDKALVAVISDMLEWAQDDKDLEKFLYDNAEKFVPENEDVDPEDVIDEFYDALDDADVDDLEDMLKEVDFEATLTFYINSGKQLVGANLEAEADGEVIKMSAKIGPSWDKISEISFNYDDGWTTYSGSFTVDTDDKEEYSAELELSEDDEVVFSGTFEWDKKDGDYELKLVTSDYSYWYDEYYTTTYSIKGELALSAKEATITLDSYTEESDNWGTDEVDFDIALTILASDKMPSMPKYTDVLEMDSEDLTDLVYDLGNVFEDLEDMFY